MDFLCNANAQTANSSERGCNILKSGSSRKIAIEIIAQMSDNITKTCPCNTQGFFSPVKIENFMRKKNNIFLIFAQNIDCGYTLEPPRRGGSNEYPQSMFWSKNKKNRYTPAYPSFAI